MKLEYVKTDKNGTKYYHDWTCPRCGGAGESSKWERTGKICFACGGTGLRSTPKVVKEYTPEYQSKLDAQRQAREQKRASETPCNMAKFGFNETGKAYVYKGDTLEEREELRASGAKFNPCILMWVSPVQIKDLPYYELDAATALYWNARLRDWVLDGDALYDWKKANGIK